MADSEAIKKKNKGLACSIGVLQNLHETAQYLEKVVI